MFNWFTKIAGIVKAPFTEPVPKPVPVPTPAPEAPAPTGTVIELEQRSRPGGWVKVREWPAGRAPLYGSSPVDVTRLSSTGIWYEAIFTVLTGTLTITDVAVGGFHKPRIVLKKRGLFALLTVQKGVTLKAGEKLYCYFILGDVSNVGSGGWKQANYAVHSKELGQIVHLSAQVLKG